MLLKMFSTGTGAGSGPVDYVCSEVADIYTGEGKDRRKTGEKFVRDPAPEILRGDADRTKMLINGITNAWTYSSGVIAFADEDSPTGAQIKETMDLVESSIFAGLENEQFNVLWVRHQHCGNTELHFVIPRMELRTGLAMNAFPPGYKNLTDPLCESLNFKYGWARPSDPARAKESKTPDHEEKIGAMIERMGLKKPETIRDEIYKLLENRVLLGLIKNRADVERTLVDELGEMTRSGDDYISIKPTGAKTAIRFKGTIYERDFDVEKLIRQAEGEEGRGHPRGNRIDAERSRAAEVRLSESVERRRVFNAQRYRERARDKIREHQSVGAGDQLADQDRSREPASDDQTINSRADTVNRAWDESASHSDSNSEQNRGYATQDAAEGRDDDDQRYRSADRSSSAGSAESDGSVKGIDASNEESMAVQSRSAPIGLHYYLRQSLGNSAIPSEQNHRQRSVDRSSRNDDQKHEIADLGDRASEVSGRHEVHHAAVGGKREVWLDNWRQTSIAILDQLRSGYDRVREAFIEQFEGAFRAISVGHEAARRAESELVSASASIDKSGYGFERSSESLDAANRQLSEGCSGIESAIRDLDSTSQEALARIKSRAVEIVSQEKSAVVTGWKPILQVRQYVQSADRKRPKG